MVTIEPHPELDAGVFVSELPRALGEIDSPPALVAGLALDHPAPLSRSEEVRAAVRDLLRHGGYKPTGRGKPASEFLVRAAERGELSSINPVVDACNVVSLASGLPISVIDLDRATPPLSIAVAPAGSEYVFNASGQTIKLDGLLCLMDSGGPCANAVKDSQRTKTGAATRRTLSVIWGTTRLPGRTEAALAWYRELMETLGATTQEPSALSTAEG